MVERSDNSASQEDDRCEQHRGCGRSNSNKPHPCKQKCDDYSREDLEEPLYPQMHNPPSPILLYGEICLSAIQQPRPVESRNSHGGKHKERKQLTRFILPSEGRP